MRTTNLGCIVRFSFDRVARKCGHLTEPGNKQRQRWALGRMVLGGHRQVVLVRPADTTLVLHVLHYPEHVRVSSYF
jgi:non-homologous end joining protein Ku